MFLIKILGEGGRVEGCMGGRVGGREEGGREGGSSDIFMMLLMIKFWF